MNAVARARRLPPPHGWRLEKRLEPGNWQILFVSLLAIGAAVLAAGVLFQLYGLDPLAAGATILRGTLGNRRGWSEIIRRATPLLLIGAGLTAAYRARFLNIGADGQLLAGAIAAAGVALFGKLPAPWLLPAMFLTGALAGAAWATVPALLKARFGINEIITSLMFNYLAYNVMDWLIHGPWQGATVAGFPYSDTLPKDAWLPLWPGTRVHWPTTLLALGAAGALSVFLARAKLGFQLRLAGDSPETARYSGSNLLGLTLLVALLSGGAAGLAGVGELAGIHHRLLAPDQLSLGYGYSAVLVALLARGSPAKTILSALLLGWVFAAGDVMKVSLRLPFGVTALFNGLLLLFLVSGERLMHYSIRFRPAVAAAAAA